MEITVSHKQGRVPVTVFQVQGDIDVTTYEQLQSQAKQAFEAGARDILLDLAGVPYVSTAGIRAINHVYSLLRTSAPEESDEAVRKGLAAGTYKSPHLKLLNPTSRVFEILSMAGVDMFLEIHRDLDAAIASF